KENISTLSQIAGGLAGALTAKANNTAEQQGGNFLTATAGTDTAKRAVENNFFDVDPHQERLDDIKLFAKLYFNGDEEKAEAYYDAMQQGKSKGVKDNVVETAEAILNLDETVKSLAYAITHPNEVIEQVYVSMDEWNQQYEYAVKHDPALAGEMQGYILGNFGSTPVSGMVVGAAGAKLLQKSAALVKKGVEKTGLPNWANSNSKLPIVGKTTGYENQTTRISTGADNVALYPKLKATLISKEISDGHAFSKHVVKQGEFKNISVSTREQFEQHIENVVNNYTSFKELSNGRSAYWHEESGTVIIRNPKAKDGGTAFQPREGRKYFDEKLK
ncbi:VENN motif pre-toxin domain-containing protein, partial [Rodentibacter trehalosifermentans]|uniref:VENN motif pre-toxin domain-containing protein n=1 Tax=Rodentibacter trehalosifermentans TaxID=1908263 RepID=UPI0015C3D2D2